MSRLPRIAARTAAALVILMIVVYSPTPMGACPPFERLEIFYDNCVDRNEIGYIDRFCGSCGTATSGSTNGLYRVDHLINCDDLTEVVIYYGRCNPGDAWTQLADENACPNWC